MTSRADVGTRWPGTAVAAIVVVVNVLAAGMAVPSKGSAMEGTHPKSGFAGVVGVAPDHVADFQAIAVPGVGPVSDVWIGRHPAEEWSNATVVVVERCDAPPCATGHLTLEGVDAVRPLAVVDLQGSPAQIPLPEDDGGPDVRATGEEARPAVLLQTRADRDDGGWQDALVLCSIETRPRLLWEAAIRLVRADGGGFTSFDLSLEAPSKAGQWLEIGFVQTTRPGKGEEPFRPGPPLRQHFVFDGEWYQRSR